MDEKLTPLDALRDSAFGHRTAEEERDQLRSYFVETEQWRQVYNGSVDVVYGSKGAGKSAIYNLISQSTDELFDRNIIVVAGENPQGAPAFQDINDDPPYDEFEFVSLWKLYILTLCGQAIRDYGIKNSKADDLLDALEGADLIPKSFTLAKALRYAFDYVRKFGRAESVETTIAVDPITGLPTSLTGKIAFREPSAAAARQGIRSVDELFSVASGALAEAGYTIWVMLDRLDVAFADKPDLEAAALRALFKFYLDTKAYANIRTKIFLRTDIWSAITKHGFREASHIERALNISWSTEDLTNLVVRRIIANESICQFYGIEKKEILENYKSQEDFLGIIFPEQVETGSNKPKTFVWILSRTKDATESNAPREVIHFLNELRSVQINRLERGERALGDRRLFEQAAFKEALPAVSKVRLEQTVFAEYPKLKPFIEALAEQKATQPLSSLQSIWKASDDDALATATDLEEIGFFEKFSSANEPTWRVPFLYRPALNLIQGAADSQGE